jgi:hypothetical protein
MIKTRLEDLVLPGLLHQTDLGADYGGRDHSDKRERPVEGPRGAADEPVLHVAFVVVTTGKKPILVNRIIVGG